jgi:hypothetical protein
MRFIPLAALLVILSLILPAPAQEIEREAAIAGEMDDQPQETALLPARPQYLEYERRRVIHIFEQITPRDRSWYRQALQYLDQGCHAVAGVSGAPGWASLIEPGRRLIAQGCDDPMVAATLALALHLEKSAAADEALANASEALHGSGYSPLRQVLVNFALGKRLDAAEDHEGASRAFERAFDAFVAAASEPDLSARELVWVALTAVLELERARDGIGTARSAQLIERLTQVPAVDPWIREWCAGEYHVEAGWERRGGGWASSVTDDGWTGFRHHLRAAHSHLVAAHELRPDLPHAAGRLISVAMAGHAQEDERYWFERAIEAQVDYMPAYSRYLWALRPRWGGSHLAMLRFGMECLGTGRFDTRVPFQMIQAALNVSADRNNYQWAFRQPRVYEACREALLGLAATQPERSAHDLTLLAAIAWRAARYDDARKYYLQVEGRFDSAAAWLVRARWREIFEDAFAFTSPGAEMYREALRAADRGMWDRAVELCEAAIEALDPAVHYEGNAMHSQLAIMRISAGFESGEWVRLNYAQSLPGWIQVQNRWEAATRTAMRGSASTGRVRIICRAPVGNRFELKGNITQQNAQTTASILVGYDAHFHRGERWRAVTIRPSENRVDLELWGAASRTVRLPAHSMRENPNGVHIQVWDDRVVVRINNAVVYDGQWPQYASEWTPGDYFGFIAIAPAGQSRAEGEQRSTAQFNGFQIRRLTEPPPAQEITPPPVPRPVPSRPVRQPAGTPATPQPADPQGEP